MALSLGMEHFFAVAIAFLAIVAFSGATHDIACDGVYMSELSPAEQAKYIGWQGAFYNIAKIAATGGLVYLSGWLIKRFMPAGGGADASGGGSPAEARGKALRDFLPLPGGSDREDGIRRVCKGLYLPAGFPGVRLREKTHPEVGEQKVCSPQSKGTGRKPPLSQRQAADSGEAVNYKRPIGIKRKQGNGE